MSDVTRISLVDDESPTRGNASEDATAEMDAPFGLKPDGTPYKRDPSAYKKREQNKKARSVGSPKRRTSPPKPKGIPKPTGRRREMLQDVAGLIQLVTMPLFLAGLKDDTMAADAMTVSLNTEPMSEAIVSVAENNERFAKVIGKLTEVGPYGALIAAASPVILQLATNHGLLPVGFAGTQEPRLLAAELRGEAEQMVAQMQQQAAAEPSYDGQPWPDPSSQMTPPMQSF